VRVLLRLRGQRFAAIDELRHDGGELQAPLNIPPHVRAIHVLGFPGEFFSPILFACRARFFRSGA
jgi:hypothetical protein